MAVSKSSFGSTHGSRMKSSSRYERKTSSVHSNIVINDPHPHDEQIIEQLKDKNAIDGRDSFDNLLEPSKPEQSPPKKNAPPAQPTAKQSPRNKPPQTPIPENSRSLLKGKEQNLIQGSDQ